MKLWEIRRALLGDASGLKDCIIAAYAVYAEKISDLPKVEEGIEQDILANMVWVVEEDDQLLAGMILSKKNEKLYLSNIAVNPIAKGQGVASALLNVAYAYGQSNGFNKIHLVTHIDMPENVALYKHLGWLETERNGNKVLMKKDIAQD